VQCYIFLSAFSACFSIEDLIYNLLLDLPSLERNTCRSGVLAEDKTLLPRDKRTVQPVNLPAKYCRLTIQRVKTVAAVLKPQNTAVSERGLRLRRGEVAVAVTVGRYLALPETENKPSVLRDVRVPPASG
jgi:hypothetical protein